MLLRLLRAVFQSSRGSVKRVVARALALRGEGRLAEAEQLLRAAVALDPDNAVASTNLGIVLLEQDKGEGVEFLRRALHNDPLSAAAHYNYANAVRAHGRLREGIEHYRAAKDGDSRFAAAPEELMHALLEACDWSNAQAEADELREKIAVRPPSEWMRFVSPLTASYLGLDPVQCKAVARFHAPQARSSPRRARGSEQRANPRRIRLAYFSRDFRSHPIGQLLRNVFALHDRERFEVHAYSYGHDDGSVYRRDIAKSVDHFVDVAANTDADIAATIASAGIDVLVDLMGHTTGHRMAVLARRPAPVQAHYLGYPATTGADYIDYFVSDEIATPRELQNHFTEELAYAPRCFMVSDGTDARVAPPATRAGQQLPEAACVFANFANPSRITREVFHLWMEILKAVPESVLWLKSLDELAVQNLRHEAGMCGIGPHRLLFAQRVADKSAHLGRLALADLALDTLGWYNGHSSTADMLWAGVPVLTAPGNTFASRVAASLVRAADLPELVVNDAREFVVTASRLGNDRALTNALRAKLQAAKQSAVFFDTPQLVQGLEAAYEGMYAAKIRGPAGL